MLKKTLKNPPACFFVSCFTVSVTPSIFTHESSKDFMILMISFISSFEIIKLNPFLGLVAPFPLIFLSILLMAFEAKLLTYADKLSLAKGVTRSLVLFFT